MLGVGNSALVQLHSRAEAIAAGRVGGYKTNCDNRDRSRRRRQPNSAAAAIERLGSYHYAHAGPRLQGQANCPLDEPPDPGEVTRVFAR